MGFFFFRFRCRLDLRFEVYVGCFQASLTCSCIYQFIQLSSFLGCLQCSLTLVVLHSVYNYNLTAFLEFLFFELYFPPFIFRTRKFKLCFSFKDVTFYKKHPDFVHERLSMLFIKGWFLDNSYKRLESWSFFFSINFVKKISSW